MADICYICGEVHEKCSFLQINKHVPDSIIPPRAKLTLPDFLEIQRFSDGTNTVVTRKPIEKGTKFGPLEAEKLATNPSLSFPLKIFTNECEIHLNTTNENLCNWMIFVVPAENEKEQNLICYQENEEIFYAAMRDIKVGEHLRVWYSKYYGQKLNVEPLDAKTVEKPLKNIDVNTLVKKQQKIMNRKSWTCKFCGQIENDVVNFGKHILNHYSNQLKKVCEFCKSRFYSRNSLKAHIRIVHGTINTPKRVTQPNQPLKESIGGPLLNNIFSDSLDNSITLNQIDINNMNHQNLLLDSDYDLFNENVKDLDHFNFEIDDNQKQFVCDICLRQFAKLQLLIRHLKHHTGDYLCKSCLKIYCRNEDLKNHICNVVKKYHCDKCDKEFFQKKFLKRHLLAKHQNKFKCPNCNKAYYSNWELQRHNCSQINIADKNKFICTLCNKIFFRMAYLKKHQKIHETKNNNKIEVVCEICGVHIDKKSYNLHIKIHNEQYLKCKYCEKTFKRKDVLNSHLKTHENQKKKFKCSTCEKEFKYEKYLKSHNMTHTNNGFKCTICDVIFKQRSTLNYHIKKKHKDPSNGIIEFYTCPICDKKIAVKNSLYRHLKKIHPNVEVDVKSIKAKIMDKPIITEAEKKEKEVKKLEEKKNNREVCLSIPDLTEKDQEIALDTNAYILDNGTIVQPQNNSDNVIIYLLDQKLPNLDC